MAVLPPTSSSYLDLTISIPGSSGDSGEGRSMRNLDINQVPEVEGGEDREWRTTLSMNNHYNSSAEDDVDGGASSPPRKKLRLSKEQSRHLEESFRRNQTLNPKQKEELAMELKLKARQVEVWFQNRRARSKLKQTEMECEYLKRWFGSLTERNRRLQKEVEQLRALRSVGPSAAAAAHSQAGAALTMCPRCERVATTNPPKGNSFSATSSAHVASATASVTASGKLPERSNLLSAASRQASSSAAC